MTDQRSPADRTAVGRPVRSSRRRVLAGLGASIATAALAGCSDVVDTAPSYEEGTVGDVEGDERTAEEMTAAEALAEREIDESVTPRDDLSFENHEFVLEDDFRGSTVQGTLTNGSDDRIRRVEVRVRVYDDADEQLGRYLATTGDLEGGSSWKFEVILLEAPVDIGSYDLAALGTPA